MFVSFYIEQKIAVYLLAVLNFGAFSFFSCLFLMCVV